MKINLSHILFIGYLIIYTPFSIAQADASVSPHHAKAHPPKKHFLNKKLCKEAFDLLDQCVSSYGEKCTPDTTDFLPGAPRSTFVFLSNYKGFNDEGFDKLCYKTCISDGNFEIEYESFKKLVCQSY